MHQKQAWYECKPYIVMVTGLLFSALFDFATVGQSLAVGLLFLGATIWVLRANYRRRDKGQRKGNMNEAVYEYWPFFHLAIGALLFSWQSNPLIVVVAVAIALRGGILVYYRQQHRLGIIKPSLGSH